MIDKPNRIGIKKTTYRFMSFVLTLFVIYSTDSLLFSVNSNRMLPTVSKVAIILLTTIMLIKYLMQYKKVKHDFIVLILVIFTILASMLVNIDITGGYLFKAILLLFGYLFFQHFKREKFIEFFLKTMALISVISIIAFLFSDIITVVGFFPIIENTNYYKFTSLFFTNIPHSNLFSHRNFGPFWEPGTYQAYLFIALFFSMFMHSRYKKLYSILFTITILTTFSTTGIFSVVLLYAGYFLSRKQSVKTNKLFYLVLLLAATIFIFYDSDAVYHIFNKISRGSESASFSSRWHSIWGNIIIFFKNPLFGAGLNGLVEEMNIYLSDHRLYGKFFNTNTVLMNFSAFGVVFGTYYFIRISNVIYRNVSGFLAGTFVLLSVVFVLSGENFIFSLLFNLIIFIEPAKKKLKNLKWQHLF